MKVGSAHLTYCTNIHAGESWSEVLSNLKTHVCAVKAMVCPNEPFGVGLRLSADAAQSLVVPGALDELQEFLEGAGLYVFTVNGFPYGTFHGQPVKSAVYRPDWQRAEREQYTDDLVKILAHVLPDGMRGSISTVPGGFREEATGRAAQQNIAGRLISQALKLLRLRQETGRQLSLALEPEPRCLLETTEEAVQFFEYYLLSKTALSEAASQAGATPAQAEQAVRDHLGVCLDTCHAAIEFESADESLALLRAAAVQISKIQLSAGLQLTPTEQNLHALRAYDEDVYLHQVVARTAAGRLLRFVDLPDALHSPEARAAALWRVHFHVPVHQAQPGVFSSTQPYLSEALEAQRRDSVCDHLEVETYTWDVLPPEQRCGSVVESIARELQWVKERL